MELAKGIIIPVIADSVLSPDILYDDNHTGIYFVTHDDQHGRITFENLDSLKVCRGEILPYEDDWNYENNDHYPWVYKIENSKWQVERFNYEKSVYDSSYEFGGNVNEMQTDFSHYVFQFHDEFVEAITRGFWFEKDENSLFKKEFQPGHPFLNLPDENAERFIAHTLTCQIRRTPKINEELINDARFCSQKLMQFALELEGKATVSNTLLLAYRNGKLISSLRGFFGKETVEFKGVATFEDVKPYLEKYMKEVYERRKAMGK